MQKQEEQPNPFKGRKYIRGIGRRKASSAVAQLYTRGKGQFIVNKKPLKDYFSGFELVSTALSPLKELGKDSGYDVNVRVSGGGPKGQSESIRLALSRALIAHNEDNKPALRSAGFITVDRRVKERKKPGLKRARRAPQWSKR